MLKVSLGQLGLEDICDWKKVLGVAWQVLVGGGTDGAFVNIDIHNGIKGGSLPPWYQETWWINQKPSNE